MPEPPAAATTLFGQRHATLVALVVAAFALAHVPFLFGPVLGHHAWRQADTAAMARNYYEIDASFLHPRIDYLGNPTGVTGSEFPLYSYLVHWGYRVVGESLAFARLLTLTSSCVALLAMFGIGRRWLGGTAAVAAVLFLGCSPAFFYFSRNIQPDVPMMAFALGGLWCWLVWRERRGWVWFTTAAGLAATAVAIKPYAVMVAAPMILDALADWRRGRRWVVVALVAMLAAPTLLWYRHAYVLTQSYGSFPYFGTFVYDVVRDPLRGFAAIASLDFLAHVLLRDLRTDYLSYAGFGALLVGLYSARSISMAIRVRIGVWIALGVGWLLLVSWMIKVHEYYALPLLPALALVAGHGFAVLLHHRTWLLRAVAILIIGCAPLMALARTARQTTGNLVPALSEVGLRLDDRILPRAAPVIIGPDDSPVVALYHAHRRGWAFPYAVSAADVATYRERGARFLISADRGFEARVAAVMPLPPPVQEIGEVRVFALDAVPSRR